MIFVFLAASIVQAVIRLSDILEATGDDFSFSSNYFKSSFRPIIFLIFPTIGIFVRNKIGWVFITQYLYFLICNMLITSYNYENLTVILIPVLLIFLCLFIINKQKVSFNYYKTKKENLIRFNLISFVIGFCISILLFIYKNIYYLN